jgi:hypothetical protein
MMRSVIISLLATLRASLRTRVALQLEILALRHQLHVLERTRPHPVLCENSADDLRGLPIVELEQAAESLTTLHLAGPSHRGLWCEQLIL